MWFCSPVPVAPDETHQVRARHDQGGLRLRTLRETRHGAAESFQRQTCSEVHQEEGGSSRHRKGVAEPLLRASFLPSIPPPVPPVVQEGAGLAAGAEGTLLGRAGGGGEGSSPEPPPAAGPSPASLLPHLQSWGEEESAGLGAAGEGTRWGQPGELKPLPRPRQGVFVALNWEGSASGLGGCGPQSWLPGLQPAAALEGLWGGEADWAPLCPQVGTHIRAKRKREELSNVLAAMRKAAAKKD